MAKRRIRLSINKNFPKATNHFQGLSRCRICSSSIQAF